uniref:Myelocytomatosis viral oncogene-like protein n=1 Tax=Nematostella vectensis TaxID=45351 RepID=A0A1C9KCU8_NEMVE|nr:myelocytomatosis viral oncogene-like protein [Nematostella vectensis]
MTPQSAETTKMLEYPKYDSPPYIKEDENFFFPNPGNEFWETFCLLTPPLSPVNGTTSEIEKHLQDAVPSGPLDELREISRFTEEAREISSSPGSAPILNDIMWNAGERIKRPDSAIDIEMRSSLNMTPVCFDSIASTYVGAEDLFSFTSLWVDQGECSTEGNSIGRSLHDVSDSDEEIDVVGITTSEDSRETAPVNHACSRPLGIKCTQNTPQPRLSQRQKDKPDEQTSSDSEPDNFRISHNDLERKRRNELRSRFNSLRKSIPELENNEKTAKIAILRKAYELVPRLQKEELRLKEEKNAEKRKNAALLEKLMKLTRACKER